MFYTNTANKKSSATENIRAEDSINTLKL